MNRRILPLAAAAALLAACDGGPAGTASTAPDGPALAHSEAAPVWIVTFQPGVADVRGVSEEMARGRGFALRGVREHAARGFTAAMPEHVADGLRADPRVAKVVRDVPVHLIRPVQSAKPDNPGGGPGGGDGGGSTGDVVPWGIARVGGPGDGTGRTAWVLDSGIDLDHPDLNTSRNCHVHFEGRSPDDGNGHGTHVAGTIAAKADGAGVVGVAAGAFVCSVRVLGNSGSGSLSSVVAGVDYVAANAGSGDVANMSLTAPGSNSVLEDAVRDLASGGVKVVIAAGNSGQFAGNETPPRVDANNVYTVSAIASNDCMPSWSNWGSPPVDYAAPGSGILSTRKGGGTTTMSGTSMAAPHVAGILLLGGVRSDGAACNDPDGDPDPIAHR